MNIEDFKPMVQQERLEPTYGCGMFIANPMLADHLESVAKANGGTVRTFLGFKFITPASEPDTLRKIRMIGRLEWERKAREARRAKA